MAEYIEPLDFRTILIDYLLENSTLFMFAFIIIFSMSAAMFGMSNKIFLILLIIGSIMFGVYIGEAIYVLILILVGFVVFKLIAKIVT
jgi:hypothetical protein